MTRADEFRNQARNVATFRDAYVRLISLSRVVSDSTFYSHRMRVPKEGHESEYYSLFSHVARLAGAASVGPGGVVREVANWKQSLDDVEALSASDVVESCEGVLGILEERAKALDHRDKTIEGKLALFIGFPSRVGAIVAEDHPRLQKTAVGVGIIGQVVVGIVATLLTAGLIALVAALWSAVS